MTKISSRKESTSNITLKRKKSEKLLDVGYFSVFKDRIVFPNGIEKDHHRVKRDDFVVIIPEDKDSFYMILQYRDPNHYHSLEFPMGIAEGKNFEEMAKNELKEETGITAKRYSYLGEIYPVSGIMEHKAHIYLAQDLTFGESNTEETEFLQVKKVSKKDLAKKIRDNKIKDSISLSAYIIYKENI